MSIILIVASVTGCGATNNGASETDFESNIQKSAYMLDSIYETSHENVLFSPLSLNMALGFLSEGTDGKNRVFERGNLF